jgi:hypothetical protein
MNIKLEKEVKFSTDANVNTQYWLWINDRAISYDTDYDKAVAKYNRVKEQLKGVKLGSEIILEDVV